MCALHLLSTSICLPRDNSLTPRAAADTTMIQTAPLEFIVTYNKYFHPGDGVSGCETADGKPLDGPKCKTARLSRFAAPTR